jgi:hypothetical protein
MKVLRLLPLLLPLIALPSSAGLISISGGRGVAPPAGGGTAISDFVSGLSVDGAWHEFTGSTNVNVFTDSVSGGNGTRLGYNDNLACIPSTKRCYVFGSDDAGDGPQIHRYDEATDAWSLVDLSWTSTPGVFNGSPCHPYGGVSANETANEVYLATCNTQNIHVITAAEGESDIDITGATAGTDASSTKWFPGFGTNGSFVSVNYNNGAATATITRSQPPFSTWNGSGLSGTAPTLDIHNLMMWSAFDSRLHLLGGNGSDETAYISTSGVITLRDLAPQNIDTARGEWIVNPVTGVFEIFHLDSSGTDYYTYNPGASPGSQWTTLNVNTLPNDFLIGEDGSNSILLLACGDVTWLDALLCVSMSKTGDSDGNGHMFLKRYN